MKLVPRLVGLIGLPVVLLVAACGSSGSTSATYTVDAVVQDLELDPNGHTTIITFGQAAPTGLTTANFVSTGDQLAVSVDVAGTDATVVWDERVTPADQVRVVGIAGSFDEDLAVNTSDPMPPSFTISDGAQTPGLGGDSFTVSFQGARVVAADVRTLSNWSLRVGAQVVSLTGTTIVFDEVAQEAEFVLGAGANLFSTFFLAAPGVRSVADVALGSTLVAGAATGDAVAPTLVSAVQNLDEDEFGRTIDFTFSEAMSPLALEVTNFSPGFPVFTTSAEQPSEGVVRVTFTAPIVPGIDDVNLTSLVDSHGNGFPDGDVAIAAGSLVINAFAGDPVVTTVENAGGDYVEARFVQAFDPAEAGDASRWELSIDSAPVDLALEDVSFDLLTKTLRINLADDYTTGTPFRLAAAAGGGPTDVDGQPFALAFDGTVAGDDAGAQIESVTQNRTADPEGATLDIVLTEEVQALPGTFSVVGTTVDSTALLSGNRTVRLELADAVIPGDTTVSVGGLVDLAGNTMDTLAAVPIVSSDLTAPQFASFEVNSVEGPMNDTLVVTFNDRMVPADVVDPANWSLEAPAGVVRNLDGATFDYSEGSQTVTVGLVGAGAGESGEINFVHGELVDIMLMNMRDLGGNLLTANRFFGETVGETNYPEVLAAWIQDGDTSSVYLRFSEVCDNLLGADYDPTSNPLGARFEILDAGGAMRGVPTSRTLSADGRVLKLDLPFTIAAGVDTVNVGGVTDLAGNLLFPVHELAIAAEADSAPSLSTGVSTLTAVVGENNDTISIVMDRVVLADEALDIDNYTLTGPGGAVDISDAEVEFDGQSTVTIRLGPDTADLAYNTSYDVTVEGLRSLTSFAMPAPVLESVLVDGDDSPPIFPTGRVRIDAQNSSAVLIEVNEAMDLDDAENETLIDLAATVASSATRLGPRTVRAVFPTVTEGQILTYTNVNDLAQNSGTILLAVEAEIETGPTIDGVSGLAAPNAGGDVIEVAFDAPVDPATALDPGRWTVNNTNLGAGDDLDLSSASFELDSSLPGVRIHLGADVDLDVDQDVIVAIDGIKNHDGIESVANTSATGTVSGDLDGPELVSVVMNRRMDLFSRVVDLQFDEDLDTGDAVDLGLYSLSSGAVVAAAEVVGTRVVRLTLQTGVAPGQTVTVSGVADIAGNIAAAQAMPLLDL